MLPDVVATYHWAAGKRLDAVDWYIVDGKDGRRRRRIVCGDFVEEVEGVEGVFGNVKGSFEAYTRVVEVLGQVYRSLLLALPSLRPRH